jgi:MFS transporter, PHS family, inorganic phosphate transporter
MPPVVTLDKKERDERQRLLTTSPTAKRSLLDPSQLNVAMLTKFLVRGLGFFNDAYDLFVMNVVNVVLMEQYGNDVYSPMLKSAVSAAALIGAVLGQLVFGVLADRLGRRVNMIATCVILIVGGVLCTAAYGPTPTSTLWALVLARGILGFGIGGEYPLSAASSAEDATCIEDRNRRVALTFSLQGLGSLAAAVMGDLLVRHLAPHHRGGNEPRDLEVVWRLLFGIGVVPALFVVYFRWRADETEVFTASAERVPIDQDEEQYGGNTQPRLAFGKLVLQHYGVRLLGTAGAWFLFDIVFYAQNLFSASLLSVVGIHDASLKQITRQNVYVALLALPGYYVAVYYINSLGRKRIQMQGFAVMAVLFVILSVWWDTIEQSSTSFIVLFGLALFFSNFGPNTSTFVLPTEMFPTPIRATCHGISAAMGKMGAALGSYGFSPLVQMPGIGFHGVFFVFAMICLVALPLTHFCVFDNKRSLDEMDREFDAIVQEHEGILGRRDDGEDGLKKISAADPFLMTTSSSFGDGELAPVSPT